MTDFKNKCIAFETCDSVDWIDTDASEDEDYLPSFSTGYTFIMTNDKMDSEDRKRSRLNSQGSMDTRDLFRRKLEHENDATPYEKLRQVIDKTIDNGYEKVDLSNIGLTEIPDEISELQYVTVLHNDVIKAGCLQLFLYNNELRTLNPTLFKLKNLTVLSLRHNHLTSLPPEIALLENLVELSIGNNQLKCIPGELLRLKKLTTISLLPNPFLGVDDMSLNRTIPITSLKEISTRSILLTKKPNYLNSLSKVIPDSLLQSILASINTCEHCSKLFNIPDIQHIHWRTVLGNPNVPVLYRFCSRFCFLQFN